MKSINLVVLGDHHRIATELGGKRGTTSDIVIYDRKTLDTLYSWIAPVTFPAKIQPLMQAINIAVYAILDVTKIDKYLGEQILALDCLDFRHGFTSMQTRPVIWRGRTIVYNVKRRRISDINV